MWGLARYGAKGYGKEQFLYPKGIATEPGGNVYVVDAGNNRIVHLFNPGKEVHWVKAFSGKSAQDPGLRSPYQIALTAAGLPFVTDTGNRRIVLFDTNGAIKQTIPSPGAPPIFEDGPSMIAVADGSAQWSYFDDDRLIFCSDRRGERLWKLDFSGAVLATITLPQGRRACYGATDYYHNLYVTDRQNGCVLKFDRDLKLLDTFGSAGKGDNQFIEPRGIAIWKRFGQIFIAEKKGAQYYWVGTGLQSQRLSKKAPGQYELTVDLTEYTYVSLFKIAGNDSAFALKRRLLYPGGRSMTFADTKSILRDGSATLRIEPTYSSHTYYWWDFPIKVTN
jgi:DNA-binding beta-propeller fold protein YncE